MIWKSYFRTQKPTWKFHTIITLLHFRNRDGRVELELEPLGIRLLKHQTVARPSQVTSSSSSFGAMAGAAAYGGGGGMGGMGGLGGLLNDPGLMASMTDPV